MHKLYLIHRVHLLYIVYIICTIGKYNRQMLDLWSFSLICFCMVIICGKWKILFSFRMSLQGFKGTRIIQIKDFFLPNYFLHSTITMGTKYFLVNSSHYWDLNQINNARWNPLKGRWELLWCISWLAKNSN